MGFAPPEDLPEPPAVPEPPAIPSAVDAGFELTPVGPALCGFALPGFAFNLGFSLPPFDLDFPPDLSFALPLNCGAAKSLADELGPGGGRQPTAPDPDVDADYG